jgi:DUF4097 and DUF4098 domain-containing protein YvlB
VRCGAGVAVVQCTGRLAEWHHHAGVGDVQLEEVGVLELTTGAGDVSVGRATGRAQVTTASGALRIGQLDATSMVKNFNGDTWIGQARGTLRVRAANGTITVDQALGGVDAKTANGDVRLHDVSGGAIVAHTAFGAVDIGIRDGVAAWLDLSTSLGDVRNELGASERPQRDEDSVEVRARTGYGDVTIRRCVTSADRTDAA